MTIHLTQHDLDILRELRLNEIRRQVRESVDAARASAYDLSAAAALRPKNWVKRI